MGSKSAIEWTDASWTPIRAQTHGRDPLRGVHCEKVSPGCANCYAERRNLSGWGGHGTKLTFVKSSREKVSFDLDEKILTEPLRWRKPKRVFVCSQTDLFGEWVPDEWIDRVFAVMALAPHEFQVLTKRAGRMHEYCADPKVASRVWSAAVEHEDTLDALARHGAVWGGDRPWPLRNVWLGVSAEDQQRLDERVPQLLATPAAVRFVSAEPLLGPLDLHRMELLCKTWRRGYTIGTYLDWVIVGGESGPKARPMDIAWARSIVEQCRQDEVACFVKQMGANVEDRNDAGFDGDEPWAWPMDTRHEELTSTNWQGEPVRIRLRDRKGGNPAEWPEDLRVREWPEVRAC